MPLSPAVTPLIEDLSELTIEDSLIPTINSLDLDVLPNGKVSMLWVVLAEDGLSLPIKVPTMVAKVLVKIFFHLNNTFALMVLKVCIYLLTDQFVYIMKYYE